MNCLRCALLIWNSLLHLQSHYLWPLDSTKITEYEDTWNKIVGQSGWRVVSQTLPVMFGRSVKN